ncbi:fimbrial biogenesis outer membrane usher protein [Caballeronia hypogeia]|uniref:Fimbrial biogenesis outer membrane usher protein n=1 Tax=Caballeronia hypogeia TaxID=1777140 RepID=A0A157ZW80_9BURK|nr:FimD/PapC N-terminal domain-containing protein [Caballeronia hypogeia]SAK49798.1 fimbrial biogenesis outer membrane usher protein [Caballeronia hypogeia]
MRARRDAPHASAPAQTASSFMLRPVAALVMYAFAMGAGIGLASELHASEANQDVEFDATFLQLDANRGVDVSRFARGNVVSPGVYAVDIFVNESRVARDDSKHAGKAS